MRIGLEMFGTQTSSRRRGVGRYCRCLAAALLARSDEHDYVHYAVDGLPTDLIPSAPHSLLRTLRPTPHLRHTLDRLVRDNPDHLDALIFTNPLELNPGNDIPALPPQAGRPLLAAVVYDLIPYLFQDRYLQKWPGESFGRRYLWTLERLRTYDLLLTISQSTRDDLIRLVNIAPHKVVAIGAAANDPASDFKPGDDLADIGLLRGLGVEGPFIFALAATDPRKNLPGLVEAYAALPDPLKTTHRLVVAVGAEDEAVAAVRLRAQECGLADRVLLLTKPVGETTLRALYRRCAVFAFPSLYEGFGLPILEAMHCGAAVVAGNNSSVPEVAGTAALLVDVSTPAALSQGLARVINDIPFAQSLREKGLARASTFSWKTVAGKSLDALHNIGPDTRIPAKPIARKKPRIAFFSPLPPTHSGIAGYSSSLLDPLAEHYAIDLFHDARAYPFTRFQRPRFGTFDHRLFNRLDNLRPYHAVIYQMGNSPLHNFIYDHLLKRPGVVVLHDLALASFHYERAIQSAGGLSQFRRLLDPPSHFEPHLRLFSSAPESMVRGLTESGFDMNAPIIHASSALIVHSQQALQRLGPFAADKAFVIPQGAEPIVEIDRTAARNRLGLPNNALIAACFGIIHPSKLNAEAVEAFAPLALARPDALLLMVGEEADDGLARDKAQALGLTDRVRFLGRPDDRAFLDLVAATDLGLALRRPPTNGETSAALLALLRSGVASLVTDTGSFAEYPEGVVRKIPWTDAPTGVAALSRTLLNLALDAHARASLALAGRAHVAQFHAWDAVAAQYAEVIEYSRSQAHAPILYQSPHPALDPADMFKSRFNAGSIGRSSLGGAA